MCCGLGSGTPQVEEGNATAEGTQVKFQTYRRGKSPLLGRVRGGGAGQHRILPELQHAYACRVSEGGVALAQARGSKKLLAQLGETGHFLCRLPVARHFLCGLRTSGG